MTTMVYPTRLEYMPGEHHHDSLGCQSTSGGVWGARCTPAHDRSGFEALIEALETGRPLPVTCQEVPTVFSIVLSQSECERLHRCLAQSRQAVTECWSCGESKPSGAAACLSCAWDEAHAEAECMAPTAAAAAATD